MWNDDGFLLSSFKLLLLLCAALFLLVVEMAIIHATLNVLGLPVTDVQALCIAILLQICIEAASSVISHFRRKHEQLAGED